MESAEIPYSRQMETSYENFIADCPDCGVRNIFNRASDLQTFQPIAFRTVTCQACKGLFNINNDTINAAHQMLLVGCFAFIERKEYMQCVLNVAQAYEVFFSHFMHVQLIYRAYALDGGHDLSRLNCLTKQLYNRVHELPFKPMRHHFLRLVIDAVAPASLTDAENAIAALPKKPDVPEKDIEAMPDDPIKALLLRLHKTHVDKLRNRVIHKYAHRPTREEATNAYDEARQILHGLTGRLRLGYDACWYISGTGR